VLLVSSVASNLVMSASAQTSEDFAAVRFEGGFLQADIRLGSNLFGSGVGGGSFGRVQSAFQRIDGAVVFGNPAALSFVNHRQIGIETRFPLRNGLFGIGSPSLMSASTIRNRTDDILADFDFPSDEEPVYTKVSQLSIGQPRQLSAFWFTWPVNENVGIGFGYRQPLLLASSIRGGGLLATFEGRQNSGGVAEQVNFLSEMALSSDAHLQLDELSVGTGGLLERYYIGSVWWGASLFRYSASASFNVDVHPQGLLTVSGTEQYFFNDPQDPNLDLMSGESNAFFWKMRAGYKGSGMGARIGLVHRSYRDRWGTSFLLSVPPTLHLWDPSAMAESWLPKFVDLGGAINNNTDDTIDLLDIDGLDLSKPNLTRRTRDYLGPQVIVHLPTSLTVGLDVPLGRHRLVVNVLRYWGRMALRGDYGKESGEVQTFLFGKKPTWGIRGGIDFARGDALSGYGFWTVPLRILTLDIDGLLFQLISGPEGYANAHYRIGAGVGWGSPIVDGLENTLVSDAERLLGGLTPMSFSIGRAYTVHSRLDVGVHVFGLPDMIMRFSMAWNVY